MSPFCGSAENGGKLYFLVCVLFKRKRLIFKQTLSNYISMESLLSQLTKTDKINIKLSLSIYLCFKLVKKKTIFFHCNFFINFFIQIFISIISSAILPK